MASTPGSDTLASFGARERSRGRDELLKVVVCDPTFNVHRHTTETIFQRSCTQLYKLSTIVRTMNSEAGPYQLARRRKFRDDVDEVNELQNI